MREKLCMFKCSSQYQSISLMEMLHKRLLPLRNYILSCPVAITGLNQDTREKDSKSCALIIPEFLWSSGFSPTKRSGSHSDNKLTIYIDFPAFMHLAHFLLS